VHSLSIECFNCRKRRHTKAECWAKGGGKEGEGPCGKGKEKSDSKALVASANAATSTKGKTKEVDATWMAMVDISDEENEPEGIPDAFRLEDFDLDESDSSCASDKDDSYATDSSHTSIEGNDSDSDSVPDLQPVTDDSDSDSDDDESMGDLDERSEFGDDEDSDEEGGKAISAEEWNTYFGIEIEEEVNTPEEIVEPFEFLDLTDEAYTSFTSAMLSKDGIGNQLLDVDLYDSGASRHMSGHHHRFTNFIEIEPKPITAANKRAFHAIRKGDMLIDIPNGDTTSNILLKDVLYAPSMGVTLVSISCIAAAGSTVIFSGDNCRIFNNSKSLLGKIEMSQGLYRVYSAHEEPAGYARRVKELLTIDELHRRLGHVAHKAARKLVKDGLVKGVELDEESKPTVCVSCEWGKGHRKAIHKVREEEEPDDVGDEVHSDLWGPASVETINRKEYFASFTDGCSRFSKIYLIRTKDETFGCYQNFEAWMNTQHNVKIKCLRSDRGGEYRSDEFNEHLCCQGTIHRLTVHDTPEYNGVSERLNRTLIEKVRAMLHASGLPKFLWGEALMHSVYIKNRTWTRYLISTTPYEVLYGSKPDLSNLHPWGCKVWVHDTNGTKLDGRMKEGRWVGFDKESKAHRIYYPGKQSVGVERSVVFAPEDVEVVLDGLALKGEDDKLDEREEVEEEQAKGKEGAEESEEAKNERPALPTHNAVPNDTPAIDEPAIEEPVAEGRGHRIRKESPYVRQIREGVGRASNLPNSRAVPLGIQVIDEATVNENESGRVADDCEIPEGIDFAMATVMDAAEGLNPTYDEAKRHPDWPKWKEAIDMEFKALEDNGTWKLVERPEGVNVVDCKIVLRIKKNTAGEIDKYKARLVARGFTQIHSVDYYETYTPVARLATFRILLATANRNNWPVKSFDFDTTFLNSILKDDEMIFMEQPKGYQRADPKRYVFRLLKALYGLKQGAKNWYDALREALSQLGFHRTEADHGTFIKKWADG